MYSPLFSILIANYNNGQYLMDAIRSVQAQTYTNWEIIIVDDGSIDNSHAIYEQLARDGQATIMPLTDAPLPMPTRIPFSTINPRPSTLNSQLKEQDACSQYPTLHSQLKIYLSPTNHGCGFTKHQCAALAHGELCGFLDPDDALTPDALQLMVDTHATHPEVAVVGSCYWATDENLKPMWRSYQIVLPEGGTWLTTTTTTHAPIPFASYKGERYLKTEGINIDLKRAVDFDLYVKLEEQGGIMFLPDITYYYRQHSSQISTHGDFKSMYWQIYVIIKACERRHIPADVVVDSLLKDNWQWYVKNGVGYEVPKPKQPLWRSVCSLVKRLCKKMAAQRADV